MAEPAPLDIDFEIQELETRLDRLRSLYEQYFLGIERIEPTVARKDVDRRFWMLRKEKIRNTARRYKLQVLIQRYNTFQQYWHRICREIEAGTYTRHLIKAEKMLQKEALTIATKRRRGAYRKQHEEAAPEQAAPAEEEDPTTPDQELDTLLGLHRAPPPEKVDPAAAAAGPKPARPKMQFQPLDIDIDDLLGGGDRAPISARPGPAQARRPTRAPSSRPRSPAKPSQPPGVIGEGRPAPAPRRPSSGRMRAARTAAPPVERGVSEERIRELHQRLSDAKRELKDQKTVSMEGLAKSLRATEEKLRKEHGAHRKVEFDVVIKDGRALVKPIVR